jgi:tetratricopeptide (TPR) repeat protein/membrane protease YdiL (CAAX protease family)
MELVSLSLVLLIPLAAGLTVLMKGRIAVTRTTVVEGRPAKAVAFLLLLAIPTTIGLIYFRFAIFVWFPFLPILIFSPIALAGIALLVCSLAAAIVGLVTAHQLNEPPANLAVDSGAERPEGHSELSAEDEVPFAEVVDATVAPPPRTGLTGALAWCLQFLLVEFALGVPCGIVGAALGIWRTPAFLISIQSAMGVCAALIMARHAYPGAVGPTVAWRGCRPVQLILVLLLAMPLIPLAEAAATMVNVSLGWEPVVAIRPPFFDRLDQFYIALARLPWPLALLAGCVAPAIGEELFFRGVIGRRLVAAHGPTIGILLTSLIFAVCHLDPARIAATFVLGLFLHGVYLATRSLAASMVLHGIYNALVILEFKLRESHDLLLFHHAGSFFSPLILALAIVAVAVLGRAMYRVRTAWVLPDETEWWPGFVTAEMPAPELNAVPASQPLGAVSAISAALCSVAFVAVTGLSAAPDPAMRAYREVLRGNELLQADKNIEAVDAFTEALRHSPNDAYALGNRGIAYLASGDYAKGLADLDLALAQRPKEAEWLVQRAWAHQQLGNSRQALEDYTEALRLRPNDAFARQQRGRLLSEHGDELLRNRDFSGAIEAYTAALSAGPEDAYTLGNRGMAYARQSEHRLALADLDRALSLVPDQPAWLVYRAGARWGLKDLDGALEDYSAVLRLRPRDHFSLRQRGQILLMRDKPEAALAELDEAAAAGDRSSELKALRGRALSELSRYEQAAAELEAVLESLPQHPTARYDLAWIRAACPIARLRNGIQARDIARALVAASPRPDAKLDSTLAAAEAECGNFAEAVRLQEKALKLTAANDRAFHEANLALYRASKAYRMPGNRD